MIDMKYFQTERTRIAVLVKLISPEIVFLNKTMKGQPLETTIFQKIEGNGTGILVYKVNQII